MAVEDWYLRGEPRRWQSEAFGAWLNQRRRGVVSVATGGGKTVFAGMCLLDFARNVSQPQVVVIVPTAALLDQWYVSLTEDLHIPVPDVATYSGEGSPPNPALVNLMVINTARLKAPSLLSSQRQTLLIVDECHRAGSPVNALALTGDHAATLGMSATPERDYDQAFEEVIVPALGPIIYRYDYGDARRDSVVAPYDLINVRISLTEPERVRYDAYTRRVARLLSRYRKGEEVGDQLARQLRERAAVSARAAMRVPVAVRLADQHPYDRVIVFHEQIQAAERIRELLSERGHHVAAYHSKMGAEMRRDNLRLFRRGLLDILVSCRALDEGVNVPEAAVAVIASSTASNRQRIQRLGRVLRPAAGKERATIYTLFGTDLEARRLAEEAQSTDSADSVSWITAGLPAARG
jgi:superfamily II DNA or RNA helicase